MLSESERLDTAFALANYATHHLIFLICSGVEPYISYSTIKGTRIPSYREPTSSSVKKKSKLERAPESPRAEPKKSKQNKNNSHQTKLKQIDIQNKTKRCR